MFALLPLDVARDAVAAQFTYGAPLSTVVTREVPAHRAPRVRTAAAGLLHRVADALTPAEPSPAR